MEASTSLYTLCEYQIGSTEFNELKTSLVENTCTWKVVAEKKLEQSSDCELFEESAHICGKIAELIDGDFIYRSQYDTVIVCRDAALKQIRSIALTKKNISSSGICCRQIVFIASHPVNLRSAANAEEHNRAFGAGKAIVEHIKELVKNGVEKGIFLESNSIALDFYKKLKFNIIEDSKKLVWHTEFN